MKRNRARQPATSQRIAIMFQSGAVDGIVAMCIEMAGAPKFEYHPSGSVVYFTPAEFKIYMQNLRDVMKDRDLDQQDKIEAREAYSSALEQYYRQEQSGALNPLSDTNALYALAGVAVIGTIGYLIWKSAQDFALAAQYTAAAQSAPQDVQNYLNSAQVLYSATGMVQNPPPPYVPGTTPLPVPPTA